MRIRLTTAALGVLAAAVAAGATGCGGKASAGGLPRPAKTITLVGGAAGDPFATTLACGARTEAHRIGARLTITDTQSNTAQSDTAQSAAAQQTSTLDTLLSAPPSGLIIDPADADAVTPALLRLQGAGTKVALVDSAVSDTTVGVTRVASDNIQGGKLAADALAKAMGDTGSVLVIGAASGVPSSDARIEGFQAQMETAHPGITVLPVGFGGDGAASVSRLLAAHPGVGGVFAVDGTTTDAVAAALGSGDGRTKAVGFDAGPREVSALRSGVVQTLIAQDPADIGRQAVDQAAAAVNGGKVAPVIDTTLIVVTARNMDDQAISRYFYATACQTWS